MDATAEQFGIIFPKYKEHGEPGLQLLIGEIDKEAPPDSPSSDEKREKLAKRQANAAVALLRMNQPTKVWSLLKRAEQPDDPRLRSFLTHRLGTLGADANTIVQRLYAEPADVTIRRALV